MCGSAKEQMKMLAAEKAKGWGDRLEEALTKVGITQDAWRSAKEKIGLPPTCGCEQRKEKLNSAGEWLEAAVAEMGEAARDAILTIFRPLKRGNDSQNPKS